MGMRKKHHTGPQTAPPDPKGPCEEPDPVEMYCDDITDIGDVHATNLGDECDPCKLRLDLAPKPVDSPPEFVLGCEKEGGALKFPLSTMQRGCYEATYGPVDPDAPSADGARHFNADGTEKLEIYDAASNCLKPVAAAPGSQVKYAVDGVATTATLNGDGAWVVEPPASNLDPDAALCAVVDAIADPANAAKLDALKEAIDTNTFPTAFSLSVVDGVLTGTVVLNEGDPLVGTATLPDDVSVNAGTYAVDGACQVTLPKSDGETVTLDLCDLVSELSQVVDPTTGAITITHMAGGVSTSWTVPGPLTDPEGNAVGRDCVQAAIRTTNPETCGEMYVPKDWRVRTEMNESDSQLIAAGITPVITDLSDWASGTNTEIFRMAIPDCVNDTCRDMAVTLFFRAGADGMTAASGNFYRLDWTAVGDGNPAIPIDTRQMSGAGATSMGNVPIIGFKSFIVPAGGSFSVPDITLNLRAFVRNNPQAFEGFFGGNAVNVYKHETLI